MRLRSVVVAAVIALAAPLLPLSPATAVVNYPAPVITGPATGATGLTGTVPITVTSAAPAVMIELGSGGIYHQQLVTMAGGAGSWDWPTGGFDFTTIWAYPCQTTAANSCYGASNTVEVIVDNAIDSWDAPAAPLTFAPDYDAPLQVTVNDDNASGDLFVLHAGPYARVATITRGVATELTFPPASYPTAETGPLRVIRCSTLNPGLCQVASGDSAAVTVRRGLGVGLINPHPGLDAFSPNADGVSDTLPMMLWVESAATNVAATWTLTTLAGADVLPAPIAIDTTAGANGYTPFTVDLTGQTVPADGDYLLQATATGTVDGHAYTGAATYLVRIDTTAPALISATPSLLSFNPVVDKWSTQYRNSVSFSVARTGGTPNTTRADILDAADKVVVGNVDNHWWLDGRVGWNGHNNGGTLLPEGDYRLRLTATDVVGNTTVVLSDPVSLSHDAYVAKTWKKTVTDQASLFANWSGKCGLLRKPGLKGGAGSLGYYSNGRCKTNDVNKGVAAAGHKVVLPAAEKYGAIWFRAYGGPIDRYNRAGFLTISNQDKALGTLQALDANWGWHLNVKRKAADMIWGDRAVYWLVNCAFGQRYDVSKVSVTLGYTVWTGPGGTAPFRAAPAATAHAGTAHAVPGGSAGQGYRIAPGT